MQNTQLKNYIDEIQTALHRLAETNRKGFQYKQLETYFGTKLTILGLSMGDQRALFKERFSFSGLSLEEQLKIYDAVWQQATIYELRFQAVFFITKYCKKLDPVLVLRTVDSWMDTVDCWPHSDDLAKVTCIAGIKIPEQYKALIKKWNTSSKAWKRRQSVVALVRERTAFQNIFSWSDLEALFLNLMEEDTYMVQKGLGWALRDTGRIHDKRLLQFLNTYAHLLSSVAFATATEKIDPAEKTHLKQLRKQNRRKKGD